MVDITMFPGRTREQKIAMMKAVTEAIVASLGTAPETVQITIREVSKQDVSVAGVPKG
jgi:4-oxalocrotonate tautomerase